MAYQSLYRRYRSQRFDEVLGQDHVTKALKNSVRDGRVAQGYLFSGPRGTGKTSTARILAKVLNCEHPADGEPDTTCANCKAVEEGRQVDWLQELDAASNNGVEAMRDLLGRVSMGTSGNRKVYVLDEVHMLSTAASNALLKTLEEPPDHVVFVLATTEPEKVLPTIRSRTQHFDFKLLGADVLADHVRHVIADADLGLGEDAVDHVVRVGGGSARDTLSALDQVAAAGGVSDAGSPAEDIVDALAARDAGAALLAVDAAIRSGRDPRVLADALVASLREAFLVAMSAPAGGLSDQAAARAAEVAEALGPASLTRGLEAVGTALVDMRQAPDPRIPLEVALVRLTRPEMVDDLTALVSRIEHIERALASGAGTSPAPVPTAPTVSEGGAAVPSPDEPATDVPATDTPAADPSAEDAGVAAPAASAPVSPAPGAQPRGADAARARLARQGATATPPPAPSADAPTGSRPTLGGVRQARQGQDIAEASPVAAPTAPERDDPAESAPPDREPSATVPSEAELTEAWVTVLESLKPRAKALYKPGRFVAGAGRMARFALPNQAHCDRCSDKRDEVAASLAAHFGRPVPLELVVDDDAPPNSGSPSSPASPSAAGGAQTGPPSGEGEEDVDLDELTDAPDASVGGIAQLQDAFPGAELVEDQ